MMRNLLHGRNGGLKHPDSSSHSHHYVPHNHATFDSPSQLLATITLSPTDYECLPVHPKQTVTIVGVQTGQFSIYI